MRAPLRRPGSGHRAHPARTADEMSSNPSAQPRSTVDIRPISVRVGTWRPEEPGLLHAFSSYFVPACIGQDRELPQTAAEHRNDSTERHELPYEPPPEVPHVPPTRAPTRPPHGPLAKAAFAGPYTGREPSLPARRTVREAQFTSRTGPPPAGNEAAASPSPQRPVRRADPRSTHANASARKGPERTARRTATREEHAGTPPAEPPQGPAAPREPGAVTAPRARVRPGQHAGTNQSRGLPPAPHYPGATPGALPAAPPRSPPPNLFRNPFPPPPRPLLRTPSRASGGSRLPSPFPRFPSPRPSPFLRLPPTTTAPAAPRAFGLPTDRRRSPPEDSEPTTIPPYGRLPLNGRDAANYAGLTDVLSRAAYSSGLGQMRVRPECRGSSLGRTRYECRAPQR
ncbi:hypothetical protein FHX80_113056 [Streptomyces brevispora]|uniref:Uncharacterized protein n=1 Tax=Streptomyces brevispora TaxID=887462 RepID=A0A561UZ05_9ACTN|nr:hypothetical protein FHX80_113056 [Streptomyces brevispora]